MQLRPRAPPNDPRPVQHGGGVELVPCSIGLEPVSASRRADGGSPLHGETRRRSALFVPSTDFIIAAGIDFV